jgi:hypothetical protein
MGAITGTLVGNTELAATHKIITVTAPVASASDTITLTAAAHGGATAIVGLIGVTVTGGLDAAFSYAQVSYSGLVLTVVTFEQDGTASTAWSDTTVEIAVIVSV